MITKPSRAAARAKRHYRLRNHISGTAERPRLAVFRSNMHIYAQIIDDTVGNTICSASTMEADVKAKLEHTNDVEAAKVVGETVAKKALERALLQLFLTAAAMYTTARFRLLLMLPEKPVCSSNQEGMS